MLAFIVIFVVFGSLSIVLLLPQTVGLRYGFRAPTVVCTCCTAQYQAEIAVGLACFTLDSSLREQRRLLVGLVSFAPCFEIL